MRALCKGCAKAQPRRAGGLQEAGKSRPPACLKGRRGGQARDSGRAVGSLRRQRRGVRRAGGAGDDRSGVDLGGAGRSYFGGLLTAFFFFIHAGFLLFIR